MSHEEKLSKRAVPSGLRFRGERSVVVGVSPFLRTSGSLLLSKDFEWARIPHARYLAPTRREDRSATVRSPICPQIKICSLSSVFLPHDATDRVLSSHECVEPDLPRTGETA